MRWKFNANVSGVDASMANLPEGLEIADHQTGFGGFIFSDALGWPTEEKMLSMLQPMISKILSLLPTQLYVGRVRGGLFVNSGKNKLHAPHVDFHVPHYTFLYYVNDSDGDTFIFNEKVNPAMGENQNYPDKFTLLERVSPKKGDAILFNGLHYHSSSTPEHHDSRIALNINLFPSWEEEL
jgi:hypothetical protein